MGCPCFSWILLAIGAIVIYAIIIFFQSRAAEEKLKRWSNTPKDLVILHGFPAAKTLPNGSPFVLKIQTYLRMAKMSYKLDSEDSFGPKGKTPWISVNGQHIADSEFIIDFLKKKFETNLNQNYTEEQLAVGRAVQVMLDEHFIWGTAFERMIYGGENSKKVVDLPYLVKLYLRYEIPRRSKVQGIGRHSKQEMEQLLTKDLRAVSEILKDKPFICGTEPCEFDCVVFSHMAQCVWGLPGSPYEKLVNGELKNIKNYCIRIRERFWSNWTDANVPT